MSTKFDTLTISNIDQGLFVAEAEKQFAALQDALVRHVRQFSGEEAAAKLTMSVELRHKQGAVFVTSGVGKKLPGLPKSITNALIDTHQDPSEQLTLFTAVGGSSTDPPQQAQLCRRDGAPVGDE